MHTPYTTRGEQGTDQRDRPPLRRPADGRELAGVCAGLARHLGLHVRAVRLAVLLATVFGGVGLVVYGFLWAFMPEEVPAHPGTQAGRGMQRRADDGPWRTLVLGVLLVAVGLAVHLQLRGLDLRLDVVIPMLVAGAGAVFAWSQLDDATRHRWVPREGPERRRAMVRLAVGIGLAVLGLLTLATQGRGLGELWNVTVAVLVVLAGVAFIVAPWGIRLWNDLQAEQAERVRATERADIAAHLHDSVLQTLALIQRRADEPGEVTRLARAQERELRAWLYAGPPGPATTLASAVSAAAAEVEDLHGVPIDLVVTGDRPLEGTGRALVRALREALLNAVRHGAPPVSVYVEVGSDGVEAFVRDHGPGFDVADVPADRLGLRESVLGRMHRHGGSAAVRRLDDGTEVRLRLPPTPVDTAPDPEGASR